MIGKLTAIAVLRTALNYFVEREIHASERPAQTPLFSAMSSDTSEH
jgi:hypothetical protein